MFLEFFGATVAAAIKIFDWTSKEKMTSDDKSKSTMSGSKVYMDYHGNRNGKPVYRSFETNEICIFVNEKNHRMMVGVNTKRIYQDLTQDKLDKENAELAAQGKKFHYVSSMRWGWTSYEDYVKVRVENDTGLPFTVRCYDRKDGKHWVKYYLEKQGCHSVATPLFDNGTPLTYDEMMSYCKYEGENDYTPLY